MTDPSLILEFKARVLALAADEPETPPRLVFDAVAALPLFVPLLQSHPDFEYVVWLAPRGEFGALLCKAFAREIEPGDIHLFDDNDPEIVAVFHELWRRTVVSRFGRAYLGWQ